MQEELKKVFKVREDLNYTVSEEGIVKIYEAQDHKVQNILRKIGFNIPKEKSLELDEFASFVFRQIDGNRSVFEIGEEVKNVYGEKAEPLYQRLILFMSQLQNSYKYIVRVK